MTTVYRTANPTAERYHTDRACTLLRIGQSQRDTRHHHPILRSTLERAVAQGILPCTHCVPTGQRILPSLSGETFGHDPIEYDGALICARCYTTNTHCSLDAFENPHRSTVRVPVLWPCTSAIIYGLVPRTPNT